MTWTALPPLRLLPLVKQHRAWRRRRSDTSRRYGHRAASNGLQAGVGVSLQRPADADGGRACSTCAALPPPPRPPNSENIVPPPPPRDPPAGATSTKRAGALRSAASTSCSAARAPPISFSTATTALARLPHMLCS